MDNGLKSEDVRRVLCSTLLIIIASLVATMLVPGLIAYARGVFNDKGIRAALPDYALERLVAGENAKRERTALIRRIDQRLPALVEKGDSEAVKALLLLRDDLEKRNAASPPVAVIPFHLNPQLLMWPAVYSCLGWLVFVYPPSTEGRSMNHLFTPPHLFDKEPRGPSLPVFTLIIYCVYEWPLWIRNLMPRDLKRKVFAYPNWDIDPVSMIMQEIVVIGFSLLLALLWLQWTDYLAHVSCRSTEHDTEIKKLRSENRRSRKALEMALDPELINEISAMFGDWQIRSVVLALGFVFFTNFFWTLVARNHDQRYVVTAIMVHLLWAISWCVISIPLVARWRYWLNVKRKALIDLSLHDRAGDEKMKKEIIMTTEPFSHLGFSLAGAASFASFILPIARAFI